MQETGTKCVPNNLTNQYLWDLDCGRHRAVPPVGKRKGMNPSATSCVNYRLLLQIRRTQKKTCASAQAGVNFVINPKVDFTYQYLWDPNSINPLSPLTSEQSQQHIAKCKQKLAFSIFCLTSLVCAHICDVLTGNLLEQPAIFRNTDGM